MGARLAKFVAVLLCGTIFVLLFAVIIGHITVPVASQYWHAGSLAGIGMPELLTGVVAAGYSLGGLLGLLLTYLLFWTIMHYTPDREGN